MAARLATPTLTAARFRALGGCHSTAAWNCCASSTDPTRKLVHLRPQRCDLLGLRHQQRDDAILATTNAILAITNAGFEIDQ
ncbi:MAG: hypothetical protein M3417_02415 [Actinomycetota bacterium]|nr:hypothetical protein [Actinomycetota bacterium]